MHTAASLTGFLCHVTTVKTQHSHWGAEVAALTETVTSVSRAAAMDSQRMPPDGRSSSSSKSGHRETEAQRLLCLFFSFSLWLGLNSQRGAQRFRAEISYRPGPEHVVLQPADLRVWCSDQVLPSGAQKESAENSILWREEALQRIVFSFTRSELAPVENKLKKSQSSSQKWPSCREWREMLLTTSKEGGIFSSSGASAECVLLQG